MPNKPASSAYDDLIELTKGQDPRLAYIETMWALYTGDHEFMFVNRPGQEVDESQSQPRLIINAIRLVVDTKVSCLYGKKFYRRLVGKKESKVMQSVWESNHMNLFQKLIGKSTLVTGNCFVMPKYYTKEQRPQVEEDAERIEFKIIPSNFVYPVYDDNDISELKPPYGYIIKYYFQGGDIDKYDENETDTNDKHEYLMYMTPDEIKVYIDGERDTSYEIEDDNGESGSNPYGRVIITKFFVNAAPNNIWGCSDIEDLRSPQQDINLRASDVSHTIAYHSFPILEALNVSTENLVRAPNKIYEVHTDEDTKAGAGFKYVTWDNAMQSSDAQLIRLMNWLCELSHVPAPALGKLDDLGSLTSGRAVGIMWSPLVNDIDDKKLYFEIGEQELLKNTLAVAKFHLDGTLSIDAKIVLGWPDNFIPEDKVETLAAQESLMAQGLVSRDELLRKMHPELPDEITEDGEDVWLDPPRSIKELRELIDKEADEKAQKQMDQQVKLAQAMPQPVNAAKSSQASIKTSGGQMGHRSKGANHSK